MLRLVFHFIVECMSERIAKYSLKLELKKEVKKEENLYRLVYYGEYLLCFGTSYI